MHRTFDDLRGFIEYLQQRGQLVRVGEEVDPDLEINAILDRLARTKGPAVLFERVKGSSLPVFGNAFGTFQRMSWAFGCGDFSALVEERTESLFDLLKGSNKQLMLALRAKGAKNKIKRVARTLPSAELRRSLTGAAAAMAALPVEVERARAACKEVVLRGDEIDLGRFPLLKLWPRDGGRYITLPLVITRDPETAEINLGIYRMMLLDRKTLCMHWLPQKHGHMHYAKAERAGRELPVAVAVGADPALEVAGVLQLMPPLDEFMIAGILKGSPVKVVKAEDSDLWVPAGAEIVLEGVVKPRERADEGPFGEFNGYYSPVKKTPVFHVEKITMRRSPLWHAATTGRPPTEIHVFTKAMERVGLAVGRLFFPGIADFNMTVESGTLYTMIVSLKKTRPYEAQDLMHFLWSAAPQNTFITNLIVVDDDIDIHDLGQVLWAVSTHFRPDQDLLITPKGMADPEKPSTYPRGVGAKMGIDATTKWPEEGLLRPMPERVTMDEEVARRVERRWHEYGF
jgi:4-hydroxy-3-polyprenylbenzoate decarboxylase